MSTRSFIAIEKGDKSGFEGVYCHWDGYPTWNGRLLRVHYSDSEKLTRLITLGDISSLGEEIGSKHEFNDRIDNETTFYGRDRGEQAVGPKCASQLEDLLKFAEDSGCEYFYLWKDDQWLFAGRGPQYFGCSDGSGFSEFEPLTDEHTSEEQEESS